MKTIASLGGKEHVLACDVSRSLRGLHGREKRPADLFSAAAPRRPLADMAPPRAARATGAGCRSVVDPEHPELRTKRRPVEAEQARGRCAVANGVRERFPHERVLEECQRAGVKVR